MTGSISRATEAYLDVLRRIITVNQATAEALAVIEKLTDKIEEISKEINHELSKS